jgi:hypothetical protein
MRVYVAARFTEKDMVRNIYAQLEKLGFSIASDWTVHENIKPYDRHELIAGEYSEEDINGAMDSDIFILITSAEAGTGVSAELGAALANHRLESKPIIYVVGEFAKTSAFHYHPYVIRKSTVQEVLDELIKLKFIEPA